MIQLTRTGKNTLFVNAPIMPAAGTMGFGDTPYRHLIALEKLGAFVTNPVTYEPWSPATGTRVVPLDAGVLVHTGLPNGGIVRTIKDYRHQWANMPVPVIVHLVATTPEHVRRAVGLIDHEDTIAGVELGLPDDIPWDEAETFVKAATISEKPVLVRLPMHDSYEIAEVVADAGADAIVICAPPRGTARDPRSGKLISGRIYGPLVKPIVLRMVGVLCKRLGDVPVIGAGGIHSPQDARDFLDAGAVAVQVDSVTWIRPNIVERIARDLSGNLVTRMTDAFPDEWHPDMGDTELNARKHKEKTRKDGKKGTAPR